jgi:hypothetical protein
MVRGVARLRIAATATVLLGMTQPLLANAGVPPPAPPSSVGPRPLNAPTLPFPEGGGKLQPVRLFRLLLL